MYNGCYHHLPVQKPLRWQIVFIDNLYRFMYNVNMINSELKKFINEISNKYNLKKVILFISWENGSYRNYSDIDLMV